MLEFMDGIYWKVSKFGNTSEEGLAELGLLHTANNADSVLFEFILNGEVYAIGERDNVSVFDTPKTTG